MSRLVRVATGAVESDACRRRVTLLTRAAGMTLRWVGRAESACAEAADAEMADAVEMEAANVAVRAVALALALALGADGT